MTQFTKRLFVVLGGIVAISILSGCGGGRWGVQYTPQPNVQPIAGAERVSLNLHVVDVRLNKWLRSDDSYDKNRGTSYYSATNDVVEVVNQAFKEELKHRGFELSGRDKTLLVGLNTFDTSWHGRVAMSVQVIAPPDVSLYSQLIVGDGPPSKYQLADEKVAESALADFMGKLFSDQNFLNALVEPKTTTP